MKAQAYKKQRWMKSYQDALLAIYPELAGKIDWHTAEYLYNLQYGPDEAVRAAFPNGAPRS